MASEHSLLDSSPSHPRLHLAGQDDCHAEEPTTFDAAQSQKAFVALLQISRLLGSELALDSILARIVEITAEAMAVESSSIYLWNEDKTRLVMRANTGMEPTLVGTAWFGPGRGIPGWVAENNQIVAVADASRDPRYNPLPSTIEYHFHAYLCAPLTIHDEVIGVVTARKRRMQEFAKSEITIYKTISKQIANVIEKHRMEAARVEAERLAAIAVSLSGVAHYIKNILMGVTGGEYLIEKGLKIEDLKQAREGWGVLRRSIRKISELVENMLNYYRDSGLQLRPVDLNGLVLRTLSDFEDRATERGVVLTPDLDLRLENVELDPSAMVDVMLNLITNAIDAIAPGRKGIVRVQTRRDDERNEARIAVIDNGAGIPDDVQPKLFNLFFTTKGKGGTGIGLAASQKLILEHGGSIDFETEPGQGSTFTVHLPLSRGVL